MTVPVLTAVTDARWEGSLVSALSESDDIHVVRRCVDVADLLAAASAGLARAALVSADLRRLDRDVLSRLGMAGVAVVGFVSPGDDEAERRLRQFGVAQVLPLDVAPEDLRVAVRLAIDGTPIADTIAYDDIPDPLVAPARGRVISVWGPAGAPGRTTVAVGLAAELADAGEQVLLVDGDSYGGCIAQLLGLLDEAPGLAAACRLANSGGLDLPALASVAVTVTPQLRVLTGISRPERWPELRPAALAAVLELARALAATVVVDTGFCLEQDEELSYDTAAPRRNAATLTALEAADLVVAVATADPVGLHRFVRGVAELREAVIPKQLLTVVNRVRRAAVGAGDPHREIGTALSRYAAIDDVRFIPLDVAAFDTMLATGRTLVEAAPKSPARQALRSLAQELSESPNPKATTRRRH